MLKWINNTWGQTEDKRKAIEKEEHHDWMSSLGYTKLQHFGSACGYGYGLWNKDKGEWIVSITDGVNTEDVLIVGYNNLADFMSHLAPAATASVLDGFEIDDIFEERKRLKKLGQEVIEQIKNREVCKCPKCTASREPISIN